MVLGIGPHEFHTTGDITVLRAHGEFSLQDAEEYVRLRNQILQRQRYVLLLIDLTHTTGMPPEARRYIAASKIESDAQNHAIAVFGARPLTRALLQLLFSAVSLIGRRPVFASLVSDEASALRYLTEQRQVIHSRLREATAS